MFEVTIAKVMDFQSVEYINFVATGKIITDINCLKVGIYDGCPWSVNILLSGRTDSSSASDSEARRTQVVIINTTAE